MFNNTYIAFICFISLFFCKCEFREGKIVIPGDGDVKRIGDLLLKYMHVLQVNILCVSFNFFVPLWHHISLSTVFVITAQLSLSLGILCSVLRFILLFYLNHLGYYSCNKSKADLILLC